MKRNDLNSNQTHKFLWTKTYVNYMKILSITHFSCFRNIFLRLSQSVIGLDLIFKIHLFAVGNIKKTQINFGNGSAKLKARTKILTSIDKLSRSRSYETPKNLNPVVPEARRHLK